MTNQTTTTTKNYIAYSALNLFNAVPRSKDEGEYVFLKEHGVVVLPDAASYLQEIKGWLRYKKLNGEELNKSFHKSWEKVHNATEEQLISEQIIHYFSTYGLQSLGLYNTNTIYVPLEELDVPVRNVPVLVIGGISNDELVERSLRLLNSGAALNQTTVEDALNVLEYGGFQLEDPKYLSNKEAQALAIDRFGLKPKDEEVLFRYLFYKATGSTLVIKNQSAYETIKMSGYRLPDLDQRQILAAATAFNRRKELWLCFKKAHPDNRATVNKIAKLSKKAHKPMKENVLNSLTHKVIGVDVDAREFQKAADAATTFQLVKAYNALSHYANNSKDRFYRIRNGKGFVQTKQSRLTTPDLQHNRRHLEGLIEQRIGQDTKIYYPSYIDYALPTSEKSFSGNVPSGTKLTVDHGNQYLLIGVHWKDEQGHPTDLDLSCLSVEGKIGWNTSYRTSDRGLTHSGDLTSAPSGATEWLYGYRVPTPYMVKLNYFNAPDNYQGKKFTFIVGYGSTDEDIHENYVIDPNKVIFQAEMELTQRDMVLGLLRPSDEGLVEFYFMNQGANDQAVAGSRPGLEQTALRSVVSATENMLRFSQLPLNIVTSPNECDVDLSPEKLTKDDLIRLVSS